VKIAFVHYPGRLARVEAARMGEAPTEFLFGAIELEREGHEVSHYEVDPGARVGPVAVRLIDGMAGRGLLPPHLSAASLRATRRLRGKLARVDVVVATTTGTAMALAAWRAAGLLRRPLVGIVAGLVNDPWRAPRRWTTRALLGRMHPVLYGEGELGPLLERAPALADRVHVNTFGVDTSFWTPGKGARSSDVVAIGNDGHRDWETLLQAAPLIPTRIRVFTRHAKPDALPPNVTWEPADWHQQLLSDDDVRELYRTAAAVVVPVCDVPQPSGQSVSLQAMACGCPVVLTRTRGLWAPGKLRDGENVLLVPPADASALAESVNRLLADPSLATTLAGAGQEAVLADATVSRYAERLLAICRQASES
jgi:glycosyltransferase involved in cell wall biosynthesis